jgi:hypothetical protein
VKLTWRDFEAYQGALTDLQWRRVNAYFRGEQTLAQIAKAEGVLRQSGVKIAHTSVVESLGGSCIKLLRLMLKGTVRWEDIETHRSAVTAQQWERVCAVLHERWSLQRLARKEGRPPNARARTIRLSIGRGCIALLNSLLGRSVVLSSELVSSVGQLSAMMNPLPQPNAIDAAPISSPTMDAAPPTAQHPKKRRRMKRRAQPAKRWFHVCEIRTPATTSAKTPAGGGASDEGALALALREALAKCDEP